MIIRSKTLIAATAGLAAGLLFGSVQLSCGSVQSQTACAADCPQGMQGEKGEKGEKGEPGMQGIQGTPGASFGECQRLYNGCNSAPGTECVQICPANYYVVSGGCDVTFGGAISESFPAPPPGPFPDSPSSFKSFDRYVCQSSAGNVQSTYALCCSQ